MNYRFLFFLYFLAFTGLAQKPNDSVTNEFNKKYLEHLIKIKIDSVRAIYDCGPLANDSILYMAAQHHAGYMTAHKRLTHYEEDTEDMRTPQDRVNTFGAPQYLVGENVLQTMANARVKEKVKKGLFGEKEIIFKTGTYGGLSDNIVYGWVHSPGHFKNITTPEYQITGVAVDIIDGRVYACQKFAQVPYVYEFEESETLFSYSDYQPEPVTASFAGIRRDLLDSYRYEWGLRHDRPEKCAECLEMVQETPFITLRYEPQRKIFILRVENAAYVDQMIQDKKDGFAVEIVEYNDYACGNSDYYEKPSRRNGQLKTNGRILEPVFRDDLVKGFKKRKKQKDVKFVSYLFGADSVKIKNRFAKYKSAQYTSEYYEINLGRLPKDVNGLWAHNLLYIQDEQICHVDFFTNYCGNTFPDTVAFDFMPLEASATPVSLAPKPSKKYFSIPFEQGKSSYQQKDIDPFIGALKDVRFEVDSVHITAYASVEGDSISNLKLAHQRAESILNIWQKNQEKRIVSRVKTEISWNSFYHALGRHPKYRNLQKLPHAQLIERLKDEAVLKDLEPILQQDRKAKIELYIQVPANNQNTPYLVVDHITDIKTALERPLQSTLSIDAGLDSIETLYTYAHHLVCNGKMDTSLFAQIEMPALVEQTISLGTKYLLYGHEFHQAFQANPDWLERREVMTNYLSKQSVEKVHPVFWYNFAYFKTREILKSQNISQESIQEILNVLQPLRQFYYANPMAKKNIEGLIFNLNMLLLNNVFPENTAAYSKSAEVALNQVSLYYAQNDTVDINRVVNMCKMAVFYQNIFQAQTLAIPYMHEPEVMTYIIPLSYQHPSDPGTKFYYQQLIELSQTVTPEVWCNFFMNECAIPFQAFDHEALRDVFCKKCEGKNDLLNQLQGR